MSIVRVCVCLLYISKKGRGPFQCPERKFGIFFNREHGAVWLEDVHKPNLSGIYLLKPSQDHIACNLVLTFH